MSSVVEQIKERVGIVEVVSSFVKLEKAGANLKGRCPFHNEKTPSFFVSPDRSTFYCFGCGAKGDIFSFIQQFDGLDFPQALKILAERAHVSLDEQSVSHDKDKQNLYTVMEAATIFFERGLQGAPEAQRYLLGRGLKEKTIRDWRVGYASNEWRSLYDYLLSNGFKVPDMLAAGLIKKTANESAGRDSHAGYYDVFRSRIVFPIWNASGKIVAFSGRIFPNDDSAPKYLNSPETVLFKKSDTMYGFDRAKAAIRRKEYSIVVEGQMDLVMSHQAGFENTVATSGTALTDLHLKRLMRLSPKVMFAFDSDTAGISAARRAAELGLGLGMEVKIAPLPEGEDPASLLLKKPAAYAQSLKTAEHIIDFSVAAILRSTTNDRERLRKVREEVFPLLLFFKNSVDRAHFLKKVATALGTREESLWEDLKAASKVQASPAGQNSPAGQGGRATAGPLAPKVPQGSRKFSIERTLLGVFYWRDKVELADKLKEIIGKERFVALEAEVALEKDRLIFEVEKYLEGSDRAAEIVEELLRDLQAEEFKMQFAKTMAELRVAEQARDPVKIEELLKKCNEISNHLIKLEKTEKNTAK
ncbi:MAG: DNA primase [Patescibacteria group bacterium]